MEPRILPASTRHAYALAFDLAFRRDPLQSLILPFVLRSPWVVALALLPSSDQAGQSGDVLLVWSVSALGGAFAWLLVDAMLRFRARSVYNRPAQSRPAPVADCYASGLRRVAWLYLTELVRSFALLLGFSVFLIPGIWLSYR